MGTEAGLSNAMKHSDKEAAGKVDSERAEGEAGSGRGLDRVRQKPPRKSSDQTADSKTKRFIHIGIIQKPPLTKTCFGATLSGSEVVWDLMMR